MGERIVTVSARIPRSQLREVERLALTRGLDKSSVVRALLDVGIRETKLKEALDLVREQKISVWRAARMAGSDHRSRVGTLRTQHVPLPLPALKVKPGRGRLTTKTGRRAAPRTLY